MGLLGPTDQRSLSKLIIIKAGIRGPVSQHLITRPPRSEEVERIVDLFPIQHSPEPLQVLLLAPDTISSRQPRVFVHRDTEQWIEVGSNLFEVRRRDFAVERLSIRVATIQPNRLSAEYVFNAGTCMEAARSGRLGGVRSRCCTGRY